MQIKHHIQLYALLNIKPKGKITFGIQKFTPKENSAIEQTMNAHYNHHGYKLAAYFFCLGIIAYAILNFQFTYLHINHSYCINSIFLFSITGKFISIHFSEQKLIKTVRKIIKIANHRTIETKISYPINIAIKTNRSNEFILETLFEHNFSLA